MITVVVNPTEVILQRPGGAIPELFLGNGFYILRAEDEERIGHVEIRERLIMQCADYETQTGVTTDASKAFDNALDSDFSAILLDVIKTLIAQFNWALEPGWVEENWK